MTRPALLLGAAALLLVGSLAAWRSEAPGSQRARPGSMASALAGAAVFRAKGCASCHDGPDTTALARGAFPSLADAGEWAGQRRNGMSAAAYVEESIRRPSAFTSPIFSRTAGTGAMPELDLSDAEVDAVVAYLLRH